MIGMNKWRTPSTKAGEGNKRVEKSAEEVALDKEAAEAIMKGSIIV